MSAPFHERLPALVARVEAGMARWLPPATEPPTRLHEAMRYAVLGGGKRLRPLLIYASAEVLGLAPERMDGPAAAVELIHTYSLIHDDLPAMDDDDLRRGRPTCHRAFDEATAILAGDALQVLAFRILAEDQAMQVAAETRVHMIHSLATASGSIGMAGGQAMDLAAQHQPLALDALEDMHHRKTGALIRASVLLAAQAQSGLAPDRLAALEHYAECIGLAFQIQDDILDVEGETEILGKQAGADAERHKATFPSILGLAASRARAHALRDEAMSALAPFGATAGPLAWLAEYIVSRKS